MTIKRKKSTATAGALLQSLIARAADENCYVVMASLDLSIAFDMVNTELLVKRLRIMSMPLDLIICTGRQLKFEIIRSNRSKIGMNTFSNKFYHISKLIGLDCLNYTFAHFKKIMKIQFLKNGRT